MWSKRIFSSSPTFAEAVALLWTLEITLDLKYPNIVVESDVKLCVDAVNDNSLECCWNIQTLYSKVKNLVLNFLYFTFS